MSGYKRAKARMVSTLKCAGEDSLAERIHNDDWTVLRKSSQIYSTCASEVLDIINYDIQTLQLGMSLLPRTIEDVKNILTKISKTSEQMNLNLKNVLEFIENPTPENFYMCSIIIINLIDEKNDYAPLILECINFFCNETEFKSTDVNNLSSLNISFI